MAEFNPKVDQVGTTNYINYSNRNSGNQAWGTLFEAVGKSADQMVQRNLRQEVNNTFAQADAQFLGIGVDSQEAAPTQTESNEVKPPPPASMPKPLQSGLDDVKNLARGYDAGSFSEKNYWTQVDSRIRQLRAQFPGYNDVIDAYTSDAINSPTANMLRRTLMDEMNAQRDSAQKALDADYNAIGDYLYLLTPEEMAQYNSRALPDDTRFRLKMLATQEKAEDQRVDGLKAKAELKAKDRENNEAANQSSEEEGYKYVYGAITQLFHRSYTQSLGRDGLNIKSLNDARTQAMADGKITPEEIQQIAVLRDELTTTLRNNAETILNGTTEDGLAWAQVLNPDDTKKVRDFVDNQITLIGKMSGLDEEGTSLTKITGTLVTAQRNNVAFETYKTDGGQVALQLGALSEASGGTLNQYLASEVTNTTGAGTSTQLIDVTKKILLGEMIEKGTPLNQLFKQGSGEIPSSTITPAVRSALENGVKIIQDEAVPVEQRANAVLSLYGQSGLEFVRSLDERPDKYGKSSRDRVVSMMASPEVYAKVKELGKKDPAVLESYQRFMVGVIPSVFKETADNLQDTQIYSKYATARIDQASGQIVVDLDEAKLGGPDGVRNFIQGGEVVDRRSGLRSLGLAGNIEREKVIRMIGSVKRLNGLLVQMKPMLDDMGVKNQPEVLLQMLGGVDLAAEKQMPTLDWIRQKLSEAFATQPARPGDRIITGPMGMVGVIREERDASMAEPEDDVDPVVDDPFEGGLQFNNLGRVPASGDTPTAPSDQQGMTLPDGTKVELASLTAEGDKVTKRDLISYSRGEMGNGIVVSNLTGEEDPPNFKALNPTVQAKAKQLAAAFGQPLRLTPIGGKQPDKRKSTSQHKSGLATDYFINDMTDEEKTRLVALAIANGATGIGTYGGSSTGRGTIHIDYRPGKGKGPGGLAAWWRNKPGEDLPFTSGPSWFQQGIRQGLMMRDGGQRA